MAKGGVQPAIFDDPAHPLAAPLAAWGAASSRFAAFLAAHRDKIRKKARGARDAEALDDLLLELAVARDLHHQPQGGVVYEPNLPDRSRVPDFAVTLRSGAVAMVEVTRLRAPGAGGEGAALTPGAARLTAAICGKFGQLVPNVPNVIVVGVGPALLPTLDVADTMRALVGRAERRELTPLEAHYFRRPGDFFTQFPRLSGLIARPWPPPAPEPPAILWTNARAAKPVPPRLFPPLAR